MHNISNDGKSWSVEMKENKKDDEDMEGLFYIRW